MDNHYKSQLVIKRFDREKVWFYDLKNRTLEQKKPKRIFYGVNIYSEIVEQKLRRIESIYSNILDKKILEKEEISLTRRDLNLIKKFLIIDGLRTMYEEGDFVNFFKSFEQSARKYFESMKLTALYDIRAIAYLNEFNKYEHKYLSEMDMPDNEKYMFCLEVLLDNDIYELHKTKCPLDIIAWAAAITESYLTFWDSSDSEEFILTDINMMSEYDMCHMMYGGLNSEKISYLISKLKESFAHPTILKTLNVMYENYNIFNISNTRCIVCINPFFKLYFDGSFGKNIQTIKPNIWPGTTIHHLDAYQVPKNTYVNPTKKVLDTDVIVFSDDDIFKYKPYKLTQEETLAMNMQFLNQCRQFLGFVNKDKVINTFGYANIAFAYYEAYQAKDKSNDPLAGLDALTKSMMNNQFYPIFNQLYREGYKSEINPFDMFDKNTALSQIGMKTNYYMNDYIAKQIETNPDINLSIFSFLKKNKEELIEFFKNEADVARKLNKEYIEALYDNKLDEYYRKNTK